jgi:phenylalanyl-tRNA synthetase beta chain
MPTAKVTTGGLNLRQSTELKLKRALCKAGAYECMHYSFFSPADLDLLGFAEDAKERQAISLINPINEHLSIMRTTLAASMIHAIGRNQKRGNLEGRLFEMASIFMPKALPLTEYPEEKNTLCVGVFGEKEDFFTLKGLAETVADTLCVEFKYERTTRPFLHPYQTAAIFCGGEEVGYLGKINYEIQKEEDMRVSGYVMEIDLQMLEKYYGNKPMFRPLPKFAEEKRDLALVMSKTVTCGEVEACIKNSCNFVTDVKLFDVYEGKPIPEDKRSMAFTVVFTPKDEEFTANTVDKFVEKILKNLSRNLEIELRA